MEPIDINLEETLGVAKPETIFWFTYSTGTYNGIQKCEDRREFFYKEKTLKELHDWIEARRKTIEKEVGQSVVIDNFGILKQGYE